MTTVEQLIAYSNTRHGLGIRVLAAKRPTKKSGIYIKEILANGLAQRDGRLKVFRKFFSSDYNRKDFVEVGDQILSINDQMTIGINRESAVNILRCAAATDQVRLYVRHFPSTFFSNEYQKLLFDEKFTDDDECEDTNDEEIHRIFSQNRSFDETYKKKSHLIREDYRQSIYNFSLNKNCRKRSDLSSNARQCLLNSKFRLNDLIELLKRTCPNLFFNEQTKQFELISFLNLNLNDRITLQDFEKDSSRFFGQSIDLLPTFDVKNNRNEKLICELKNQLSNCQQLINELNEKISTCEKSQRLAEEVEIEYENLLKYLYQQMSQLKFNQINQSKIIQQNQFFVQKLFFYLSNHENQSIDQQVLAQFKQQYQQISSSMNPQLSGDTHSIISDQIY